MILERLKRETRAEHARIEQSVGLLGPDLTRDAYVGFLERTLGYFEPIERRLQGVPGWAELAIDLDARQRTPLLLADLRTLGLDAPRIAAVDRARELPDVSTFDRALGCLYVLEGSTLGGRILVRELGPRLGLEPASGLAFLNAHGEHVGRMWSELGGALTRHVGAAPGSADTMVASARETFATLASWHERARDHRERRS